MEQGSFSAEQGNNPCITANQRPRGAPLWMKMVAVLTLELMRAPHNAGTSYAIFVAGTNATLQARRVSIDRSQA